jgi:nucleotide-binding universal stress UspA family protein
MAQKILVATDLSPNSRSCVRFAIQLGSQTRSTLVFLHVLELLKPSRWSETRYNQYVEDETAYAAEKLRKFVDAEYPSSATRARNYECVVQHGHSINDRIIEYAKQIAVNFICISTQGAGVIKRIIGTTASVILTTSPVPVLVVPKNYRKSAIKQIFYSSDFNNLAEELEQVKTFAEPLKAKVSVYHYDYLVQVDENVKKLKELSQRYQSARVSFHFQKQEIDKPLSFHLKRDVKKSGATLVVLFTKQNRGWYERILLSSQAADLSFVTTQPLLVFRKRM